ncbi:MAG: hypothetical protein A2W25_07880 [candidate division Zixibacteria bacterium RBG_16_53_22]|nr:MAG: hypothetical protein A2W25_07880 [candidate division Zixibacteria bacterium RBG_16_53_22]
MEIQKPTVLDAARIAAELDNARGNIIISALVRHDSSGLYLALGGNKSTIHCLVEKRYAYLGYIEMASTADLKSVQPLTNHTILSAGQLGADRIVKLSLERNDRLGRKIGASLIFELIPSKGNVVLVNNRGEIKWSLRKTESDRYKAPAPLRKPTVLNIRDHLEELSKCAPKEIIDKIYGLNPMDIRNLRPDMFSRTDELLTEIEKYASEASKPGPAWIIKGNSDIMGYSLMPPKLEIGEEAEEFDSALLMYPYYYSQAAARGAGDNLRARLTTALEKEIGVQRRRCAALSEEIDIAHSSETLKLCGDLILANLDQINKGMGSISLPNFEGRHPERVEIKLDPSKSAAANAREYYERFKKLSASLKILEKRLESTRKKLSDLEAIRKETTDDLGRLEEELAARGLVSKVRSIKKRTVEKRLPYKRYLASNGWEIFVGRTSSDNDELTCKIAHKHDYWFHAWQAAGSHTVLRLPDKNAIPDKKILYEAASLAAYYSKARTSGKVPVIYTQAKYVRKPRNFPPGKVLVEREKQLLVGPADIKKYQSES